MAIKIPSKNIYEIDNPKIRDNMIDTVSVEQTVVSPNNEYEVSVYNEDIMNFSTEQTSSDPNGKDIGVNAYSKGYSIMGAGTLYYGVGAYCAFNNYKKTNNFSIKIPKLKNNHFINKLYYGKDEEGNSNIKYTISGYVNMGTASSTFTYNLELSGLVLNPSTITYGSPESSDDIKIETPKKETYSYSGTYGTDTISATANATFYNSGTILTAKPSDLIENGIEYYILTFNVIAGWRVVKMGGYKGGLILAGSGDFPMSGTYEEYIPTNIEITIYGNTIGIDLTNNSVTYGSGKNPHSLSGNELLQSNGKVGDTNLTEYLANNVLNQYANGKETATLLCSISDYYTDDNIPIIISNNVYMIGESDFDYHVENLEIGENESGIMQYNHLAIIRLHKPATTNILFSIGGIYIAIHIGGTENTYSYIDDNSNTPEFLENIEIVSQVPKMVFEKGDDVIPYIYGADGKDRPMSKNKDGSAKVFEVVGSNIIYDGAVWQELTLLEKTQNN